MKIAIASSGLGHITRGIETWAHDTARALHQQNVDVTLFCAAPLPNPEVPTVVLPCLERNLTVTRVIARLAPGWSWRWNLKSPYALEQLSFWHRLQPELRRRNIDLLHLQDPQLALLAQHASERNRIKTRILLAHGTEEPHAFLQQFPYLQHLAPWHLEQSLASLTGSPDTTPEAPFTQWCAIPNFVDTNRFQPPSDPHIIRKIRTKYQIPPDRSVIGTAAAIKKHHKRIDWLIREFACALAQNPALHLVIAGSRQKDTDELQLLAQRLAPGHITFLIDHAHDQMPILLQTFDWFVLTSLFEMMPIAILEAIATGLPVITHTHPVLSWMTGPGGITVPMDKPNALALTLQHLDPRQQKQLGHAARQYAMDQFSQNAVIHQYIDCYRNILCS